MNRPLVRRLLIALLLVSATSAYVLAQGTATPTPNEAEISGRLTAFRGSTMIVGGQVVDVSNAEIVGNLEIGGSVRVRATFSDGGIWIARVVRVDDGSLDPVFTPEAFPPVSTPEVGPVTTPELLAPVSTPEVGADDALDDDEVRLTGVLEAVGEGVMIVSGQPINITNAELDDALILGAVVRVDGVIVNGQFIANEVRIRSLRGLNDDWDDNDDFDDNDDWDDNDDFDDNDDWDDNDDFDDNDDRDDFDDDDR